MGRIFRLPVFSFIFLAYSAIQCVLIISSKALRPSRLISAAISISILMRVPLLFDKIIVAQLLRRQEVQNSRLPAGQSSDLMKPYGIQKLSPFRLYFPVLYDIIIGNKMRK